MNYLFGLCNYTAVKTVEQIQAGTVQKGTKACSANKTTALRLTEKIPEIQTCN